MIVSLCYNVLQDSYDVLGVLPYIMDAVIWISYPNRLQSQSIKMLKDAHRMVAHKAHCCIRGV
jgi:hypothetical protein